MGDELTPPLFCDSWRRFVLGAAFKPRFLTPRLDILTMNCLGLGFIGLGRIGIQSKSELILLGYLFLKIFFHHNVKSTS